MKYHEYTCKKTVEGYITVSVDENASKEEIEKIVKKAMYQEDVKWDGNEEYEIIYDDAPLVVDASSESSYVRNII